MPSYNRNNIINSAGLVASSQNRGFFNKLFRDLSNLGMNYQDMMNQAKNQITSNDDGPQMNAAFGGNQSYQSMYDIFTKRVISKILSRKSIAYLDRTYEDKRKILRQYSIKDEIKGYLNTIVEESIHFDDDNFFCSVHDLPTEIDQTVRQKYQEVFRELYQRLGFSDGLTASNYLKNLLIDGYVSFEIVYDSKMKRIVDLIVIDPITMVIATDPETNTVVWIVYPDDPQRRKILLDVQVIYISYSNNNEYAETSYIEPLIKPYNQLKLLEQTRLLYNINQAAIYKKFIIPVNGLTRQQAEQQIHQLMAEYHEDITFDDQMGTVSINGSSQIPHSKDFWFPSGEAGQPTMEIVASQGTNLNEDTMLQWFHKNLKVESRIPYGRFDESTGGGNVYNASSEITRDEMRFSNYIRRVRTIFKEIIVKPLRTQMILLFPELKDDNYFLSNIKIIFKTNELFEEWNYLTNLAKRAEIASSLNSNLQTMDPATQAQVPYLHIEWIVRKIMKLTDEDIAENERYKLIDKSKAVAAQGGGGGGGGPEGGGGGLPPAQGGGGELPPAQGGPQAQGGAPEGGGGEAPPAQGGEGEAPAF